MNETHGMNEISVMTFQNPYKVYTNPCYANDFIPCKNQDVQYGTKDCNTSTVQQPLCSKKDLSVCPPIDGNGPLEQNWGKKSTQTALKVYCKYNCDKITTAKGIKKFKENFVVNKSKVNIPAYDILMSQFCSQSALKEGINPCPIDPITGKQMTNCSKYVSRNKSGKYCRQWMNEVVDSNDPLRKQKLQNSQLYWCSDKGNLNDCRCLNAKNTPTFNEIKSKIPFEYQNNPSLWYKPCTHTSNIQPLPSTQDPSDSQHTPDTHPRRYTRDARDARNTMDINNNSVSLVGLSKNFKQHHIPYINFTSSPTEHTSLTDKNLHNNYYLYIFAILFVLFIVFISIFIRK